MNSSRVTKHFIIKPGQTILTLRSHALFMKSTIFFANYFLKDQFQLEIMALKMRFRQKLWHRWKALGQLSKTTRTFLLKRQWF